MHRHTINHNRFFPHFSIEQKVYDSSLLRVSIMIKLGKRQNEGEE